MIYLHRNLKGLATIASKDSARYALSYVKLCAVGNGYRVEATDGRRLAIVQGVFPSVAERQAEEWAVLIPQSKWSEAMAMGPDGAIRLPIAVERTANGVVMQRGTETVTVVQDNGLRFPSTDTVRPKNAPLAEVTLNVALLISLLEVCQQIQGKIHKYGSVTLKYFGQGIPIGLSARGGPNNEQTFDALLMPMDDPKESI